MTKSEWWLLTTGTATALVHTVVLAAALVWRASFQLLLLTGLTLWASVVAGEFWATVHHLSRQRQKLLPLDAPRTAGGQGDVLVRVRRERDIVDAITHARTRGYSVRPLASRGSSQISRAADERPCLWLDLSAYDQVVEFRPERRYIHVQAGMLQRDFCKLLADHGLAVRALNGSGFLTIGGTIVTGSVCGSRHLLSDCVVALTVVEADGNVRRIERDRDADVFGAHLCSLGLLGVLSSIELELEPSFTVAGRVVKMTFEELLELSSSTRVDELDYMVNDWYPSADHVLSRQYHRVSPGEPVGPHRVCSWLSSTP